MEGISAISIVLSLVVILAFLTFSQDINDRKIYSEEYIYHYGNGNETEAFGVSLPAHVSLSREFPLRIRASEPFKV